MSIKPSYLALLLAIYFPVVNARNVEFNTHLLDTENRNNVDLSAYSREGYVAPGEYILDIILNGKTIKEQQIVNFYLNSDKSNSFACLTPSLIDMMALKMKSKITCHFTQERSVSILLHLTAVSFILLITRLYLLQCRRLTYCIRMMSGLHRPSGIMVLTVLFLTITC